MANNNSYFFSRLMRQKVENEKMNKKRIALRQGIENINDNTINQIAAFNMNGFKEIIHDTNNMIEIMGSASEKKTTNSYLNDKSIGRKFFGELNKDGFFDYMRNLGPQLSSLTKKQSGDKLISNVVKLNELNVTASRAKDVIGFSTFKKTVNKLKELKENGGEFVTYDLETLGGKNLYGHQQFDFITEVSATKRRIDKSGEQFQIESINSLMGFSKMEYDSIKEELESLRDKTYNSLSDRQKVLVSRLSMMSDENIKTDLDFAKTFEVHVIDTKNAAEETEATIENAIKGLNRYRSIGEYQENWIKNNEINFSGTLEDYKKRYYQKAVDLITGVKRDENNNIISQKDILAIGQNNINFDNQAFIHALGYNPNFNNENIFDLYQFTKYAEGYLGQGANLKGLKDRNGKYLKTTNKYGTGTQDQLKYMFSADLKAMSKQIGEDITLSHNGHIDETVLSYMLLNTNYVEKITKDTQKISTLLHSAKNIKDNDVFLMNTTSGLSYQGHSNALGFVYNPINKTIKTYDGFEIDEDGKVSKSSFNQYGPKKNGLYQHEVYELDLNSEEWNHIIDNLSSDQKIKFYQEYKDQDKLYLIKSKEYQDIKKINKKFGKNSSASMPVEHYRFAKNQSELESMLGHKIGVNNNGILKFNKKQLKRLNLRQTYIDSDGKIGIKNVSIENASKIINEMSINKINIDSGARAVRDMSYIRMEQIRLYQKLNNGLTVSKRVSDLISRNKTLDLNINKELTEELGWVDFTDNNTKKLIPESIRKAEVIDNYLKTIDPIMTAIENEFASMDLPKSFTEAIADSGFSYAAKINDYSMRAVNEKKNILFQNVLNDVIENLSSEPLLITSNRPIVEPLSDLQRIDFNMYDLFPELEGTFERASFINQGNEILSLDLNRNDSLLKMFYDKKFGNDPTRDIKGNEGFNALYEAYERIGHDPRFKNVWGNLTPSKFNSFIEKGQSYSTLNDIMLGKLKTFVNKKRLEKGQSGFGLLKTRTMQDPYEVIAALKTLQDKNGKLPSRVIDKINEIVHNKMQSLDVDVLAVSNRGNNGNIINTLVNDYFMNIDKDRLIKNISGYTEQTQRHIMAQYNAAYNEARNSAKELIEAIGDTDINLLLIGKDNKKLFLKEGNKIRTLNYHQYVEHNGIIFNKIGDQEYANQLAYNINNYVRNGKVRPGRNASNFSLSKDLMLTNNVEKINGARPKLKYTVEDAIKTNKSLIDSIADVINKRSNSIRESSPRKETGNFSNAFLRQFQIDTNDLIKILPELSPEIDRIGRQFNIENKYIQMFKDAIQNDIKVNGRRTESVADLLSVNKNIYLQKIIQGLPSIINREINKDHIISEKGFNINLVKLLSYTNFAVKNTDLTEGLVSNTDSPYALGLAKFDKGTRPPQFQAGNTVLYDKDSLLKEVDLLRKDNKNLTQYLSISPSTSTKASEMFMFNNKGRTSGMTMRYLQIDSNSIKNIVKEDVNKARADVENNKFTSFLKNRYSTKLSEDEIAHGSKILAEKAMNLSTYEQESIMNSRLAYMAFYKNNSQIIDAKKNLLLDMEFNINTIKSYKNKITELYPIINEDGTISYKHGYEVKNGELLGKFGDINNPQNIYAKNDGVFRARYFDGDRMLSEKELNDFLKDYKNLSDVEKINKLNNTFSLKYQVIDKFDNHGKKVFTEASEKSTVNSLEVGLGSIDTSLLEDLRDELKDTDINIDSLKGKILSREYLEDYLFPKLKNKELKNRILNERFSLSDALQGFKEFKGYGMLLDVDVMKHESFSMIFSDVLNRIKDNKNRDIFYEAMFKKWNGEKIDSLTNEAGSIMTDNVERIKIDKFTEHDFEGHLNSEQLANELNSIISKSNLVKDENGNVVGHEGIGHVVQLRDDHAGTYSGNFLAAEKAQRDLIKINRKLEDSTISSSKREKLLEKASELEKIVDRSESYKGVKYSKNMNNILRRTTYNDDTFEMTRRMFSQMGNESEFDKYFGFLLNESNHLKADYRGKSILAPLADSMSEALLRKPGELTLGEIEKARGSALKNNKYLIDSFGFMKNKLGVEKAKLFYSIEQGLNAMQYNRSKSPSQLLKLTNTKNKNDRFKIVDLTKGERLDLDIGGQGDTITHAINNPYTQNLMIKYGENQDDYLAIPRMIEKHFDDSLIKTSHIQSLSALQNTMDEILSGNYTQEEIQAKKAHLNDIVDNIIKSQKKDITSKDGLFGQALETRMDQSYFGKASGFTINSLGQDLEKIDKSNKLKYLEELRMNNGNYLDNVKFGEKTLLEHYAEGKVIDNIMLSKKAFEKMGYFDYDFMKKIFGNMNTSQANMSKYDNLKTIANQKNISSKDKSKLEAGMEDLLSTYGDMFVNVRYPELQEGSDKVVLGFLNKDVNDNEIKVFGATGLSMNLDHDGDTTAVIRAKKNGESYINYLTNEANSSEELQALVNGNRVAILSRAVGTNRYWNEKMQDKLAKESKIAKTSGDDLINQIHSIAKTRIIDNEIFQDILPNENLTYENMAKLNMKYSKLINMANEDGGHERAFKYLKNNLKEFDVEDLNAAKTEYATAFAYNVLEKQLIAKSSNKAIGEINVTNNKVYQSMLQLLDPMGDDKYEYHTFLMKDIGHRSEEAAISAKSATDNLDPDRAKIWNEMQIDLITGNGDKNEIQTNMKKWMNKYLKDDLDLSFYYSDSLAFRKKAEEKLGIHSLTTKEFKNFIDNADNQDKVEKFKDYLVNDYVNLLGDLRNKENVTKILDQYSLGQSKTGVYKGTEALVSTGYQSNLETVKHVLLNSNFENQPLKFLESKDKITFKSFSEDYHPGKFIEKEEEKSAKKTIGRAILEETGEVLKGVKGSKLAIGTLGLAAAIMVAGYTAGRPRPADTHAMEESDEYDSRNVPSLADPGIAYQQSNGKSGYVININAKTNKSKDRIVHAMQEAFSSQVPGNINLQMNINDNYGNINDKEIANALADVLG